MSSNFIKVLILLQILVCFTNSQDTFSFDLFNQISQASNGVNFIVSPYSAKIALSMAQEGAKGQTQSQILQTCNLPTNLNQRLTSTLKSLQTYNLQKSANSSQIAIANSMWTSTLLGAPLDSYTSLIKKYYLAQVQALNFGNSAQAAQTINNWISKKTNNLIQNVLPPSAIDVNTYLVLVNALFFKGYWQNAFNKNLTSSSTFQVSSNSLKTVPMMQLRKTRLNYYSDDNLEMVELPYQGGQFVLDLILPNSQNGNLESIKNGLSSNFESYLQNMYSSKLNVILPKFTFKQQNSLNEFLQNMGITTAFNKNTADFSGIDGKTDLYISQVIQQSMIQIDEEGTTAAAATVVVIETKSIQLVRTVNFDHPFVFILRNVQTNDILFMGQVNDPSQ